LQRQGIILVILDAKLRDRTPHKLNGGFCLGGQGGANVHGRFLNVPGLFNS